jgi:hypothetical protein
MIAAASMTALKPHLQRPLKRDLRVVHMHPVHVSTLVKYRSRRRCHRFAAASVLIHAITAATLGRGCSSALSSQ